MYPSSPAALWTRSASCWPTRRAPSFSTREAVVSDTPARSATSCSVTRCRSGRTSVTRTSSSLDRLCRPAYSRESPFPNDSGGPHFTAEGGSMTRKVIQVALNGVTGRMGYRQHLVRSLLAIREQGGIRLDDGTVLYPEPVLVGRSEDRLRAIAERHGSAAVDHQPGRGARRPGHRRLLRHPGHQRPRDRARPGDRGGQAHLHGKAARRLGRGRLRAGRGGQDRGHHPRHRPGQAVPARRDQAPPAGPRGVLRPGAVGPAGVRLLGVRRRRDAGPAPVLELPRGRRRRHRARHVPALALPP